MAGGSAAHRTACTGHRGSIYGALSDLVVVLSVPLPVVRVQSSRPVQAMAFERRPGTGPRSLLSGADPTEEIQAFSFRSIRGKLVACSPYHGEALQL